MGSGNGVAAEHSLPSTAGAAGGSRRNTGYAMSSAMWVLDQFASLGGMLAIPWPSQSGYGACLDAGVMSDRMCVSMSTVSLIPVAGRYAVTNNHRGREVSITRAGRYAVTNNLSNVD